MNEVSSAEPLTASRGFQIDDVTFYENEDRATVWRTTTELPRPGGGTDEGRLMVRFDVDGQFDIVYAYLHSSDQVSALDRTIETMRRIRDRLTSLYGDEAVPGRCWAQGDWGRCRDLHGHDGDHAFPTEEERRAQEDALTAAKWIGPRA